MPFFLGLMAFFWFIAGLYHLADALQTITTTVMHQQYVTRKLVLSVLLLSFGTLFCAACTLVERLAPKAETKQEPTPASDRVDQLIPRHAR